MRAWLAAVGLGLAALLLFVVTQAAAGALWFWALGIDPGVSEASSGMLRVVLATELTIGVVFLAVTSSWGVPVRSLLALEGTGRALVWLAPLLALVVGGQYLGSAAIDEPFVADVSAARAVLLVVVAFAIGLAEEIVFRGVMVGAIHRHVGAGATVAISTVLFVVPHLPGNVVNAAAVGLAVSVPFALVRLRGGSIAALVIAHGIVDSVALLALGSLDLPSSTPADEAVGQLVLASMVSVAYIAWYRRAVRRPDRSRAA